MSEFVVAPDRPDVPDVLALLERHLALMRATSPPEDVHALDIAGLLAPEIFFFSLRREGELLGVGALKRLDPTHAEIKSMHTAEGARGQGVGRVMLSRLLTTAGALGCSRVSLETGSMAAIAPARALYLSAGFELCAPFADYLESPNSTFLTLELNQRGVGEGI